MSDGASQIAVEIGQALPDPPDVKIQGSVPGGLLVPVTPFSPELPLLTRNIWRLTFPFTQGYAIAIRRIHILLPVWLEELGLESQEIKLLEQTKFKTEVEAGNDVAGEGGHFNFTERVVSIGPNNAYEREREENPIYKQIGTISQCERVLKQERSVLPITIAVLARLIGPEGQLWSTSIEAPLRYVPTLSGLGNRPPPGKAIGTTVIDSYADLTNPIEIDPSKAYGLQLLVFIPSSVSTNTQLGLEVVNEATVVGKEGAVTFLYDVETVSPGK